MHRHRYIMLTALLVVSLLSSVAGTATPTSAAPNGPDPSTLGMRPSGGFLKANRLEQAEKDLGANISWYVGMAGRQSKDDMRGSVYGQLRSKNAVLPTVADRMNLVMTVPLAFGKQTAKTDAGKAEIRRRLKETASGKWDADYRNVAENLVAGGYPDTVIRLGHEFTGGWYPWSSQGNADAYIEAYRHVHQVFRSVSSDFTFEWNAARNTWLEYGRPAYPGDGYVDVVGIDIYYEPHKGDKAFTEDYWNRRYLRILQDHQSFAAAHGKTVSYAEWAVGGVDQPEFITKMHGWFASLPTSGPGSLLYHSYFNVNNQIYNLDNYPNSKRTFNNLFGGSGYNNSAAPPAPSTGGEQPPEEAEAPSASEAPTAGETPAEPETDPASPSSSTLQLTTPTEISTNRAADTTVDISTNAEKVVWWKVRGPGKVSWSDKRVEQPVMRFWSRGTYVIAVKAVASDGEIIRSRITVKVN